MDPRNEYRLMLTRRQLFGRMAAGIGTAALASLLNPELFAAPEKKMVSVYNGIMKEPHFAPKAKRVIYLFQSGAPSHIDLFDYKPQLQKHDPDRRHSSSPACAVVALHQRHAVRR